MTETTPKQILWLDLETTGLNPNSGFVLEIAAFLTDMDGNPLLDAMGERREFQSVLKYPRDMLLPKMDDFVIKMHMDNGLLKEVWTDEDRWFNLNAEIWGRFKSFLDYNQVDRKNTFMAGNSIHFDRSWLGKHLSSLLERISHRMIDVSSFLLVRPDIRMSDGKVAHRAMADAEMSHDTFVNEILPLMRPGFTPRVACDPTAEEMAAADELGKF